MDLRNCLNMLICSQKISQLDIVFIVFPGECHIPKAVQTVHVRCSRRILRKQRQIAVGRSHFLRQDHRDGLCAARGRHAPISQVAQI